MAQGAGGTKSPLKRWPLKTGLLGSVMVLVLVVLCTSPSKVEGKPWSHTNINCLNSAYWPGRTNDPDSCLFGWVADSCHVMFCAKGPREMCGGKNNRYGLCGEGLMCGNCDRCVGCSTKTFDCFQDDNCIYK